MPSIQSFYKTTFTITALSEGEPLTTLSLKDLAYEIDQGSSVGIYSSKSIRISPKAAARLLHELGSDPGFFNLDDKGRDTDQERP